jgi:Rab family protein
VVENKAKMDFSANNFSATYKVLVLGDSNVGKTCIVHRYCDERYYDTYISTIGKSTAFIAPNDSSNIPDEVLWVFVWLELGKNT